VTSPAGLVVDGLTVEYRTERGPTVRAVDDVSFVIEPGGALALVGESGSGKTSTAMSIARLLPASAAARGSILLGGTDVTRLRGQELRRWWTHDIGVVVQDPARALNPTMRVGHQVAERFRALGATRHEADRRAVSQLARVGLDGPALLERYPYALSGGQQQRVLIAIALAASPSLLILDEPTTGLDSVAAAGVLGLIRELRADTGAAVLHVTHDLDLARGNCDRVAVLHDGTLVEAGSTGSVLSAGAHASTRRLLVAAPSRPTDVAPTGIGSTPVVDVRAVAKRFGSTTALDGVTLQIADGEVLGLVGPSGSGKTTLARIVAGLARPTEGEVRRRPAALRMVFQNPAASLNPRRRVRSVLQRALTRARSSRPLEELIADCRLDPALLDRRTSRLSGGQQQRVAIARALAADPALLICDEPVTSLDAPSRAGILDLLGALQRERGMAMLFISHDLAAVEHLADRIVVLEQGRVVTGAM
jgi:peptide/nickel transport system ATP-binding protein